MNSTNIGYISVNNGADSSDSTAMSDVISMSSQYQQQQQHTSDISVETISEDMLIEIQDVLLTKIILMVVIAVFIVLANVTLVATIVTHRALRRKSNYFVIALACADLAMGAVSVPLHVLAEAEIIAK